MNLLRFLPSHWVPQPLFSSDDLKQQLVQKPRPLGECKYSLARLVLLPSICLWKRAALFGSQVRLLGMWEHQHAAARFACKPEELFSVNLELSLPSPSSEAEQWQTISHRPAALHQPLHQQPLHQPQPRTSLGRSWVDQLCLKYQTGPTLEPDLVDCEMAGNPGLRTGMGTRSCGGCRTRPGGTQTTRVEERL